MSFYTEVFVVGIATMIVGLIVTNIMMWYVEPKKEPNFNHWISVALAYFITGALIHVIAEYSNVNKWYCKHGYACRMQ